MVREGWFQGTADKKGGNWRFHPATLGEPCSHIQVLDVNGDGSKDLIVEFDQNPRELTLSNQMRFKSSKLTPSARAHRPPSSARATRHCH